jgi:hypothetical protein
MTFLDKCHLPSMFDPLVALDDLALVNGDGRYFVTNGLHLMFLSSFIHNSILTCQVSFNIHPWFSIIPFVILLQVWEFDWSTILYKPSPSLHLTNISHLTPLHISTSLTFPISSFSLSQPTSH